MHHPPDASPSSRRILLIVATGALTVLAALGFGRFSMALILPSMQEGLGLSSARMGTLVTAGFSGYLAFAVGSGVAAARWGASRVVTGSLFVTGLSLIALGLSSGFWIPLFALVVAGVAMAGVNVPIMAMINAWVPPQRRGLTAGILCTGSSLSLLINGKLIPPILAAWGVDGWRAAWIILGSLVIIVGIWAACILRDAPGSRRGGTSAFAIFRSIGDLLAHNAALRQLGLIYFAFGFSYVIFTTFFGSYLIETRGWTTAQAGELWAWVGVCSLPSAFVWGAVSDRIGRRLGMSSVYLVHTLCLCAFASLPWEWGIVAAALIYGLCLFSNPAIISAACADAVGTTMVPLGLGAITLVFGLGQMTAPAVAGLMLDRGWGMVENIWLSALVAFLGAAGSLTLPGRTKS